MPVGPKDQASWGQSMVQRRQEVGFKASSGAEGAVPKLVGTKETEGVAISKPRNLRVSRRLPDIHSLPVQSLKR